MGEIKKLKENDYGNATDICSVEKLDEDGMG